MPNTDKAKTLIAEALERLERSLAAGQSDELRDYLKLLGRFHRYSFHNCLLIASQRPGATQVAGFRAWKKLGRWVRKGEKGIAIVVPITLRKKDAEEEEDTVLRFRLGYVFDLSQTEGEPLPERPTFNGDPGAHLERLHGFAGEIGVTVRRREYLGPGVEGTSSGGDIELLAALPPAREFEVLAHELAHELLHKVDPDERPTKAVRETEAEAVAFAVSEAIGLDGGSASSDYISLWQGDVETFRASIERIRTTAGQILSGLEEEASG